MSTLISPRLSRLLAVALLVFVLAIPYLLILRPYVATLQANRDALAEQVALRDRYAGLAAAGAGLDERLEDLRDQSDGQSAYLEGASEALVAADLQNRVKTVVQDNGAVLNSTQILEAADEDGFRRLAVRVRMAASTEALYKALYALESDRPFLFIDNIDINAHIVRRRDGRGEDVELMVVFDLFGFMRPVAS
jgi:general secretion pathway protein M